MKKSRKSLFLYGLVALLVLALTGAAWAAPTDTTSSEQKSTDTQVASVFKDVQAGDNNLIYINYLAKREIISGFPDGGFHPAEGLTRAQAAVLLVKSAGLSNSEQKAVFKDVDAGHWAAGSITAAANAGYLKGYPDGNYHPEEKLTRAQGISLVLRISMQKDPGVELPALKDLDSKHWAARSVAIGLDAGMVGLSSDKTQFLPDTEFSRGDLTRALAILMTTDPDLSQVPLNGSLEIKKGDVKVNDQAASGTVSIQAGDQIATGAGVEAQLSYPDGSGLLIKENTQISVKETKGRSYIKQDGSPGIAVDWLLVDLKKGDVFGALATNPNIKEETSEKKTAGLGEKLLAGISGALQYLAAEDKQAPWYKTAEAKKVKVKVDMPYGVAAIRGSFWNNAVTSTGCSTSSLEGDVQVGGTDGQTVPVPAGQSSSVAQGSTAPTPPAPMTPAQVTGWVQQGNWLQTVAQTMQSNQEAVRTEPVITQVVQTPVPGQPAPLLPVTPLPTPVTPITPVPPAPPVPDILNVINQALTQVQQNAGFTSIINLNNVTPVDLQNFVTPPITTTTTSSGGTTTTEESSTTPASVLASLVNTPAYLQVNSITVSGSTLSLSGKTYPNSSVRLGGGLLQIPAVSGPVQTADAYGNFSFSGVSINSSASAQDAFLIVDQLLDSTNTSGIKATLGIPNVLNSPSLPAIIKINRGLYTDANTPVLITGKILPAQSQTVNINMIGGTALPWTGTVTVDGSFSIPIGVQSPGTQLGVCIDPATTSSVSAGAGGHTYVYAANEVGVMFTMPQNGDQPLVATSLNSVQLFFDRNVALGSNSSDISITPTAGAALIVSPVISGNVLNIGFAVGSLAASQTYTVNIPAGAIQDAANSSVTLPAYSFSFSTAAASIIGMVPIGPTQIYAGDPCIFPATVRANMSDGTTSEFAVTWNPATINTSTPGTYTFTGTVAGYSTPVIFTLIIKQLPGASSDTTVFSENFESTLAWTTDGLWNVLDNSSDLQNGAVPKYVTLPYGDVSGGYLPNTPYGSKCLWYGKTSSTNPYEVGNFLNQQSSSDSDLSGGHSESAHSGNAITPTITVPSTGTPALSFNSWWEIESVAPAGFDIMTVHILNSSGTELAQLATINPLSLPSEYIGSAPIAYSSAGKDVPGIWQNYSFPLTSYLGQDIKIKFQFNTGDGNFNGFRGWFIDEVKVLGEAPVNTGWSQVGTTITDVSTASGLGLVGGIDPFIAYRDTSNDVNVKTLTGGSATWNLVGSAQPSSQDILDLSLQATGPVVAYVNSPGTLAVSSYVYDTCTWANLTGGDALPSSGIAYLALDVSPGGQQPYLAYRSGTSVQTYVYEPTGWRDLYSSSMAGSVFNDTGERLCLNASSGQPYLAFRDVDRMPTVIKYDGYSWESLGNPQATSTSSLALAVDGCTPYIAFRDGDETSSTAKGKVMQSMYEGSGWQWTDLGTDQGGYFSTGSANYIDLAVANNVPFVAYSDGSQSGKLTVKYFVNSQWLVLGTEGFSAEAVTETRIRIFNGSVYVTYKNSSGEIAVMKHSLPTLSLP